MSEKAFLLAVAGALLIASPFLVSLQIPQSALADRHAVDPPKQPHASVLETVETQVDAEEAPFAFVNQPWDWVEGRTTADVTVQAVLIRGGSSFATAQTVADAEGWFALQFLQDNLPVDILEGDQVAVAGGILAATIDVIIITGTIDVISDTVSGQMSGGVFPADGLVGVGRPSDTDFVTRTLTIAMDGTYLADFGGEVDIENGFVAKVWYTNPDGNQVRKIIYSEGLDVRARVTEDVVDGVTMPGATVVITVTGIDHVVKGSATAIADRSGYYRTQVLSDDSVVDIVVGDSVTATALGEIVEIAITVRHVSQINPTTDTVSGQLMGGEFPADGRVDLWNAETGIWHSQDVRTDAHGYYLANFSGVVDVGLADRILVWYKDPNGNQIASVTAGLEIGASTASDLLWGYTTPEVEVNITVRAGPAGPIIGQTSVFADETGFFETKIANLDIESGQQVEVLASGLESSLFIVEFDVHPNFKDQTLSINAAPNAVLHIELNRLGESTWIETTADDTGRALIEIDGEYDLRIGDRLDLISYEIVQGRTLHQAFSINCFLYLPILLKSG